LTTEINYNAKTSGTCAENLVHPVLYPHGEGGHFDVENASTQLHHNRVRLCGVNAFIADAEELLVYKTQQTLKNQIHAPPTYYVTGNAAANGIEKVMLEKFSAQEAAATKALKEANPGALQNVTANKSMYSGALSKNVVGSKQYWAEAYMELIAMLHEHGPPQYFVTFTANEFGWSDMTGACDGVHHGQVPVKSTRHYFHRWELFHDEYLKPGRKSPLGQINNIWYRQEDQSRGSLHVHAAIWVEGEPTWKGIHGTAPKVGDAPTRPEEGASSRQQQKYEKDRESHAASQIWRDFVIKLQTHNCRAKCKTTKGVHNEEASCK
jgi:hypothetical protein